MVSSLRAEAARIITSLYSAEGLDAAETEAQALRAIHELVENEARRLVLSGAAAPTSAERGEVASELFNALFRFGPLQNYLEDESVEELVLNAPDRGFVLYAGGTKRAIDCGFSSEDEVRSILGRAVARA